ncbi:MAG: ParB/RepB/Spo0J family partition protein [Deltaproteobacteria bacterium]|nr:ParB/RepB/Spo0J family partition protein [Deltaproteobacteria bacterium]
MKKNTRTALGRGLSSLISTPAVSIAPSAFKSNAAEAVSGNEEDFDVSKEGGGFEIGSAIGDKAIRFLDIELIENNTAQPRQEFNEQELAELAESIKSLGVLQPVIVRPPKGVSGKFEIVAGERRWRAAKIAQLRKIPVIVKEIDDRQSLEIALVENIQRSALNPIEEAQAFEKLMTEFSLSQKEVAERVGRDRASVANFLRLLKLPDEVISHIKDGKLSMGHAKAILSIREPAAQLSLARKVISEGISVRALEAIIARVVVLDTGKASRKRRGGEGGSDKYRTAAFPEVMDRLRRTLGTKVNIYHHPSGRGRIEIEYFSEQELDRLVDTVCAREG